MTSEENTLKPVHIYTVFRPSGDLQRRKMMKVMDKYIPAKMSSSWLNLPYITRENKTKSRRNIDCTTWPEEHKKKSAEVQSNQENGPEDAGKYSNAR